jgi:hypothetical protein
MKREKPILISFILIFVILIAGLIRESSTEFNAAIGANILNQGDAIENILSAEDDFNNPDLINQSEKSSFADIDNSLSVAFKKPGSVRTISLSIWTPPKIS